MRVTISDSSVLPLEPHVTPSRTLDQLVELCVRRISHVGPMQRFVVLTEEDLNLVENRLGTKLPINAPGDVHKAIDGLADVKLGKVSLQFSPSEMREIEVRAAREGVEPERIVEMIVYAMKPQFFAVAPVALPARRK